MIDEMMMKIISGQPVYPTKVGNPQLTERLRNLVQDIQNPSLSCRQEFFYVTQQAGNGLQRFLMEVVAGAYQPVVSRRRILACGSKKGFLLHGGCYMLHG